MSIVGESVDGIDGTGLSEGGGGGGMGLIERGGGEAVEALLLRGYQGSLLVV